MSRRLLSAARTPITTRTRPAADRTAPRVSKGRRRVGRDGIDDRATQPDDHRDDHRLEHERRPPTDRGGDETSDQRSGGGADASHPGDHTEGPGPRRDVGEEQRREDVDGRDQQGGADAFEDRVAEDQDAEAGRGRADQRADPVDDETDREAPLAAPPVGQLAAGNHERRHHQQEHRDRDLHALHRRVQVLADVGDHHVHVRAREAADELRERERNEDLAQRRRCAHTPSVSHVVSWRPGRGGAGAASGHRRSAHQPRRVFRFAKAPHTAVPLTRAPAQLKRARA